MLLLQRHCNEGKSVKVYMFLLNHKNTLVISVILYKTCSDDTLFLRKGLQFLVFTGGLSFCMTSNLDLSGLTHIFTSIKLYSLYLKLCSNWLTLL